MKKNILLLALVAALVFMLIGCGEALEGRNFDDWTLSDLFGSAPFTADIAAGSGAGQIENAMQGTGLQAAGGDRLRYDHAGKKFVMFTSTGGWGPGLDLLQSHFKFVAGDVVKARINVLTADASGRIFLNSQPGGWDVDTSTDAAVENVTPGWYTLSITLSASNVSNINGASPSALRISGQNCTFEIHNVVLNDEFVECFACDVEAVLTSGTTKGHTCGRP